MLKTRMTLALAVGADRAQAADCVVSAQIQPQITIHPTYPLVIPEIALISQILIHLFETPAGFAGSQL